MYYFFLFLSSAWQKICMKYQSLFSRKKKKKNTKKSVADVNGSFISLSADSHANLMLIVFFSLKKKKKKKKSNVICYNSA